MNEYVLLTHSRSSVEGGLEVFSRNLKNIFPSLQILGKEDILSEKENRLISLIAKEPQLASALAQLVEEKFPNPKVIFANGLYACAIDKKKCQTHIVTFLHGTYSGLAEKAYSKSDLIYWRMKWIYSFFEKKSAHNASIVISNSFHTQREALKEYGINSHVVELPINTKIFNPGNKKTSRKKLGIHSEKKMILFDGNPTHSKGFDIIIQLAKKHPEYDFHCVLNPVVPATSSNMKVYPFVPQERLVDFYRAADVLIFPSRYEGFGFVPLEALASGCPVIASKVGIFNDFDAAGATIVPHSLDSFERAIESVESFPNEATFRKIKKRFSFTRYKKQLTQIISGLPAKENEI